MKIKDIISNTFKTLYAYKVRTILTMMGVIIGVFAVIILISIVKGVENYVTEQFNALGSNLIIISPGRVSFNQDPASSFSNNKLDMKHIDTIKRELGKNITGIIPTVRVGFNTNYKNKNFYASVVGTSYDATNIMNIKVEEGRFFTRTEELSDSTVAIIGPQVKKSLFGDTNVLGKTIKIKDQKFEVIGVLGKQSANTDERVVIPYTTIKSSLGVNRLSSFTAKAGAEEDIDETMLSIRIALSKELKPDEFTVLSQKDILESVQSILGILGTGLAAIAGISLLVGGIGIMNIMMVSVNERIKEIGLRKAIGATSLNIGTQFFIEALFISLTGGIIGILLAVLGNTFILRRFIPSSVPLWSVLLSIVFSIFVGIVFGTYPAFKASRKDPIEALRYE